MYTWRTQGLFVFGTKSSFYPGKACYGVIITARCDFAQNKIPNVHFVTAIPITEWVKTDLAVMAALEVRANVLNRLKKQYMVKHNLDPQICFELGPRKSEIILKSYESGKSLISISQEIEKWILADRIIAGLVPEAEVIQAMNTNPDFSGKKKEKIDLVLSHRLNAYYFFTATGLTGSVDGFVANFRDIQSMEMSHFNLLIEHKIDCKYDEILQNNDLRRIFFLNNKEDFAAYIDVIPSPEIEHLMQSFAFLYSRIGIRDINPDVKEAMHNCI